jgi:hypothetical protein
MKFSCSRLFSVAGAVILTTSFLSCTPPSQIRDLAGGNTYMHGLSNPGVQTKIPWDMRLGQGHWDDPGNLGGSAHIVIDRPNQTAYFYRGDTIVGRTPVSVGSEGHDTPAGNYKILEKKRMHYSGTWGVAKRNDTGQIVNENFSPKTDKMPAGCHYEPAQMPYALRIVGGYFMHVGYVPGYAASHGCIRVPEDMAKKFWENASVGFPVTII